MTRVPEQSQRLPEQRTGTCVYCGKVGPVEDDHVVPCTLFVNENQSSVVVPCCRRCNVKKSAGEGDLRDYLVGHKDSSKHPGALARLEDVVKSTAKGFSPIGLAMLEAEIRPAYTSAGIYLGDYPTAEIDSSKMMRTLRYVVRGLYYDATKAPLSPGTPADALVIPSHLFQSTIQQFARLPNPGYRMMGDRIFWWVPYIAEDAKEATAWLMCFYDGVAVIGATGRAVHQHGQPPAPPKKLTGKQERRIRKLVKAGKLVLPPEVQRELLGPNRPR